MSELNWGEGQADADYQSAPEDGDLVLARTLDDQGTPVQTLLRYDATADAWVSGSDVTLNGNDLSANLVDANEVSAENEVTVRGTDDGYDVEYLGTYQSESDLPAGDNPAFAFVIDENDFATRGI